MHRNLRPSPGIAIKGKLLLGVAVLGTAMFLFACSIPKKSSPKQIQSDSRFVVEKSYSDSQNRLYYYVVSDKVTGAEYLIAQDGYQGSIGITPL